MSASQRRSWTQQQFFDWAEAQNERFEFDGLQPVAMTGGNANHTRITNNLHAGLRERLRGTPCSYFGPDLGICTVGDTVRYPDALVTCTKFPGNARVAPNVVIVFEVLSPSSGRMDRIVKVREYQSVASIRRYIIVESIGAGVTVLEKQDSGDWKNVALTGEDTLHLPEIGIEMAVAELYQDVEFTGAG